jgi:hypothetical protein
MSVPTEAMRHRVRSPMSDHGPEKSTLLLSRTWNAHHSELSFVTRSVAGAASRTSEVTVIVPAAAGQTEPDGAFDLFGTGIGRGGSWPTPSEAAWPAQLAEIATIIVDEADTTTLDLLDKFAPGHPVRAIAHVGGEDRAVLPLAFTDPSGNDDAADFIGLHVPINPIAATHRHNGLGFTGYLLVLSDRAGSPDVSPPTDMVAWLTARFPGANVVVVEDVTAAVWRGRVLRGVVPVYTRTDLWRLLAHARITIDLAPGRIIARECIESLRFGTPIIVPAQSAARPHADAGGGMTFTGYSELLASVTHLSNETVRDAMSSDGRRYADARYGDQGFFVSSVTRALGASIPGNQQPGPSGA